MPRVHVTCGLVGQRKGNVAVKEVVFHLSTHNKGGLQKSGAESLVNDDV